MKKTKLVWFLLFAVVAIPIVVTFLVRPDDDVVERNEQPTRVPDSQETTVSNRPITQRSDGYAGHESCRSCHTEQYDSWHASYHRTMTQVASPESVVGEFPASFQFADAAWNLYRDGSDFRCEMPVPLGRTMNGYRRFDRPLVLTTGSHHMQAYWFPVVEDARVLAMLPFVYLIEDQKWIPQGASFLSLPTSEPDIPGRWNIGCIRCHATRGQPGVTPQPGETTISYRNYKTRVADFGIACEACHGPGAAHVRWHESEATSAGDGHRLVHPDQLTHKASSQVCGQCHGIFEFHDQDGNARFVKEGWEFRPGMDLNNSSIRYLVQCSGGIEGDNEDKLRDQFWQDGMVRVSGREYNGLVESPCFQRGDLSCLSCHAMHQAEDDPRTSKEWANDQLEVGMHSNVACLQCHEDFTDEQYLTDHSHHSSESTGSLCYNCHMPHTTYGLLKAIRSHQISSPTVTESLQAGRPNACNQCHLDRTLQWTADNLAEWYNIESPELNEAEQTVAASVLWALRGDAGQRALVAWSFGWDSATDASGNDWIAPFLANLMRDRYEAVRYIAGRSLKRIPNYASIEYDFLGEPEHFQQIEDEILASWRNAIRETPPGDSRQLLIDLNGDLNNEEFRRHLLQRDERPVNLQE